MAVNVIKKDGTKEPFDAEKIRKSIAAAALLAGLSEERKNEVVNEVGAAVIRLAEEKEEIATSEIRDKILEELNRVEPSISAAWRKYEEEKRGA